MKLSQAKICINCDELFQSSAPSGACPVCGEDNWRWLQSWVRPLRSAAEHVRQGEYDKAAFKLMEVTE